MPHPTPTYMLGSSHWFAPSHPTSHPYPLAPPHRPHTINTYMWMDAPTHYERADSESR
ncbi:MAG: hypothetical protein ACR2M6_00240 [Vampirovibrionia bacterium]